VKAVQVPGLRNAIRKFCCDEYLCIAMDFIHDQIPVKLMVYRGNKRGVAKRVGLQL